MPRLLERNGLELGDFDFYEIHEAFASQVLMTLKAWQDPDFCSEQPRPRRDLRRDRPGEDQRRTAPRSPPGTRSRATGGRIVATLAKLLAERGSGRGLISICAAGGQGV